MGNAFVLTVKTTCLIIAMCVEACKNNPFLGPVFFIPILFISDIFSQIDSTLT